MVNEGLVEKNNNTYVYLDKCTHDNHFYLKCENCKSLIHVDFMIGTSDLSIVAKTVDGREVVIFEDGNFTI